VQDISILWNSENQLIDVVGNCSCPLHFNCKHVVAVCLAYRAANRLSVNRKAAGNFDWLENVQRSGQAESYRADQPDCVVFILSESDRKPFVQVELKVSRRLKRGGMGVARNVAIANIANPYLRPAYASRLDADITRLLLASDNDSWQSQKVLRRSAGALALEKMVSSGRCFWRGLETQALSSGPTKSLDIYWQEQSDKKLKLVLSAGEFSRLILTDPSLYLDTDKGKVGELDSMGLNAEQLQQLVEAPELAHDQAQEFSRLLVKRYSDLGIPPPRRIEVKKVEGIKPMPVLELDRIIENGQNMRCVRLQFKYIDWAVPGSEGRPKTLIEDGEKLIEIRHDEARESELSALLQELGFMPYRRIENSELLYVAPGNDAGQSSIGLWAKFLNDSVPELQENGWEIVRQQAFGLDFYEADHYWGEIEEETHDWFNLRLDIEIDGRRISLLKLLLPLLDEFEPEYLPETIYIPLDEANYVSLSADEIRPYLQTLYELYDTAQADEDHVRLSRYDAALLYDLENQTNLQWQGDAFLRELGEKLSHFEGVTHCPVPDGFLGTLRDYQEAGLNWLAFLREYRLNGILADDMGLGKTVQTVAHIQNEKQSARLTKPVLVIAPTSLMGNWRREINHFAPGLKVVVLQGPDRRHRFSGISGADVVLTTYPLLPRDSDTLLAEQYHLLVLDEAQLIKNPRAKAAQVVRKLQTKHRLCLTGTPMENHLGELWAQFDFLMPGFLGNLKTFKRVYQNPIEKHGDGERRDQLARRVAPFMLRRKKDEVEKELPPKTEMIRSVPLGKAQAALYETIRLSMESRVRETIASKGLARSHITILDALLKLRQTCCDPGLLKLQQAKQVKESAKLEMLMEMLPELLEEGRRILIFSQFVSMLNLIETVLNQEEIGYLKLTGQTRKRDEVIEQFDKKQADVFLISLKAGGVGLNLTSADTVILYDPWWNPAVEAQAMDRTHRIGQDKPVFVYKLLTEGTVEEKILALQEHKKALAEGVYGKPGEHSGNLSNEDIQVLFEPLG
ncbi:MAG: DEAD/DEAH box helicase, partial [Proteobacteria bacterium]|nr:DEAD/DEAH box helicase [Pseudomonadota bacterium]